MKKIKFIILILLFSTSILNGQIPQDYPFKIIVADNGYLYLTGERHNNVVTEKYNIGGEILWSQEYSNPGYDRGMDLVFTSDLDIVMLQVEMEFLNNYICKLAERKFQNEREKTLHSRTKNYHSQRTS